MGTQNRQRAAHGNSVMTPSTATLHEPRQPLHSTQFIIHNRGPAADGQKWATLVSSESWAASHRAPPSAWELPAVPRDRHRHNRGQGNRRQGARHEPAPRKSRGLGQMEAHTCARGDTLRISIERFNLPDCTGRSNNPTPSTHPSSSSRLLACAHVIGLGQARHLTRPQSPNRTRVWRGVPQGTPVQSHARSH